MATVYSGAVVARTPCSAPLHACIATVPQDWRLENDVDSVLERPHPHFDTFKRAYRHGVHCRALDGQPVFIEVVGGFKAAYQAFKDAGAPEDAGILHSVYINEWMVKDTTPEALPRGKCYKIVDAKGLGLSDFRHPAMTFARQVRHGIDERLMMAWCWLDDGLMRD